MPYAIYRVAKLKSIGAIRGSAAHNARTRATPNADTATRFRNKQLIGFAGRIPTPDEFHAEWERQSAGLKRKRDAVLVQELFLGVSPEFYTECDQGMRPQRLEAWKSRAVRWLQDTFGDRCMSATLHMDETTPHLACYVLPTATAKDGSRWLSAKKLFNPVTLRRQQDSYAAAMADLGLQRGIRGSVAKHIAVQTFYGGLTQGSPLAQVEQAANRSPLAIPERKFLQKENDYRQKVEAAVDSHLAPIRAAARALEATAQSAEVRRRQAKSAEATNRVLSRRLEVTEDRLKETVAKLRDIPLDEVLSRLGFGESSSEGNVATWDTGDHLIRVTAQSWTDEKTGKRGRKAIDLVSHIMACGYVEAVAWLAGQWPAEETAAAIRSAAEEQVASTPKKTLRHLWEKCARPNEHATVQVMDFLEERFQLRPEIVENAVRDGMLHGSVQSEVNGKTRTWCVFNHLHENGKIRGCTLRAVEDGPAVTRCIGDRTTSFFRAGPALSSADSIALVGDPLAALSYLQLSPKSHVLSLAGSRDIPATVRELVTATDLRVVMALNHGKGAEDAWIRLLLYLREAGVDPMATLRRLTREIPFVRGRGNVEWNDVLKASIRHEQKVSKGEDHAVDPFWNTPTLNQKCHSGPSIS